MSTRDVVIAIIGKDLASPALLKAAATAETAAGRMGKAGASMQKTGVAMSKAVTLPVIAAAAVSVDQAMKFQKSMTLLQTAGGETAAKMTVISKGIKDVAVATGTSLTDLSAGMYTVAKAGSTKWTAVEQLQVLKAAAQGAKAENVDLGTATSALTSILMSYHLGADKAVSVQNELVIGAGKAKTTMQEYAASLSTVVPIASAAGISFAQIGGAIATLTQHGTSAQEATQELAFTIRSLQAPNNVASKAMQQLGLNVTDVQKNLGARGLTGTIDLVTNAIKNKMGPSGLVVVDAFKKSQSATADLGIELSKMPKRLADISTQFETGKMSYKAYYTSVKSLGGASFELGKGFIATMAQAKGFNTLLAAGNPAATTFAAYLTKVMGGATGLNTALQLGGENMAYFKTATADIAKAAQGAGGDVLGWAKTQDTLAVKMDKAKANLQVFAVELGTALIPAISKVVGWLTSTVQWFDNLSSSWKKTIGISVLVVAALGPLLAIIGRVTKAIALMWAAGLASGRFVSGIRAAEISMAGMEATSYTAGLKVRSAILGISSAASGMATYIGTAFRTAGQSLAAIPAAVANAEGLGSKLGAVGTGAMGATRALAPLAIGLGAVVGGVTLGMKAWNDYHAQQQAAQQAINDVTNAIIADNGALGVNTRAVIANDLEKSGALKIGAQLGLNLQMLTDAAMGNGAAQAALAAKLSELNSTGKISAKQLAGITWTVGGLSNVTSTAASKAARLNSAIGTTGSAATTAASKVKGYVTQLEKIKSNYGTTITVQYTGAAIKKGTSVIGSAYATGGKLVGPGTGTSDSMLARVSNGEYVSTAASTSRNEAALAAGNRGARLMAFAKGGKVWDVNGKQYATALGAHNAEVQAQAAAAKAKSGLRLSGFAAFLRAMGGSAAGVGSAGSTLLSAAMRGGASSDLAASLSRDNAKLVKLATERAAIASKMTAANATLATAESNYNNERSSVASTSRSSFDVTTAGVNVFGKTTASGIVAGLKSMVAKVQVFAKTLKTLRANGVPAQIIAQLAEAGPINGSDAATALLSASKSQINALKTGESALTVASNSVGTTSANALYLAGVNSAKGVVAGLKSQQKAVNKAMTDMADAMVKQIKHDLGIKSPSTVFHQLGAHVSKGMENGVKSGHHGVRSAIAGMYSRAEFPTGRGGSGGVHIENLNVNQQSDPSASAHEVVRHIIHAGI